MNNQWPLMVAILLIAGAAAFGWFRRESATEIANTIGESARPLPTQPASGSSPAAKTPAPRPAPAQPKAVQPAPVEQPAPQPQPVAQPAPQPVAPQQPAVAPGPVPKPRVAGRFQVLLDLQEDLKTRLQMIPIPLANGGYKFSMPDALVEVVTTPSWQITVYNMNPKQPEIETDGFKTLLAAVTTNLGINTNQKPVEAATGKSYLRTVSKMGSISLEKDPAAGNTVLIRPITPTPAVDVAQPAQPQPAQPVPAPQPAPAAKKPAADF